MLVPRRRWWYLSPPGGGPLNPHWGRACPVGRYRRRSIGALHDHQHGRFHGQNGAKTTGYIATDAGGTPERLFADRDEVMSA
jgi:hypothetical protein